jgi:transmembrane sensor
MNPDPSSARSADEIDQQAAEWLARRDRGFSPAEQDAFFQWLAEDPRNGDAFAVHQQTVARLKLLAQWRPENGSPNPDLFAIPKRRSKLIRAWFAPIVLAAAAAVAAVLYHRTIHRETSVVSNEQSVRRKVLEDGSTIDLYRGATVEVNYSSTSRNITLVNGEATFTVAKNHDWPFIVDANGVKVRAVGTAFNVNLESRQVTVLVTEGRVQVTPKLSASNQQDPARVNLVDAGQRTSVMFDGSAAPQIENVTSKEMSRLIAWQPRQLEFDNAPLGQVVAEFNAHNRVKMVIDVPSLAALQVGASLRSDNVEGFVRVLETSFHVHADRPSKDTIVLRPAD